LICNLKSSINERKQVADCANAQTVCVWIETIRVVEHRKQSRRSRANHINIVEVAHISDFGR
jgi:hypothetical protein